MEIIIIVGVALVVLFILFKIFKAFIKWGILILVLVLVVAYFTNPEELTHFKGLKDVMKENITDKLCKSMTIKFSL